MAGLPLGNLAYSSWEWIDSLSISRSLLSNSDMLAKHLSKKTWSRPAACPKFRIFIPIEID